ncbi:NUDIX hydrolase [Candidatus Woesearchaeota archaeon]|nr:NUDIX hydrolase [Candidatus Woesearchaeota archaeon]
MAQLAHQLRHFTDYKQHVGSRYQSRLEDRATLLGVGAIIETSDGCYVFGQYSKDGKYNLISGGLDPKEDMISKDGNAGKTLSLDHGILREMHEEIGVTVYDIISMRHEMLCSALHDGSPNVVYRVQLNITCAELDR